MTLADAWNGTTASPKNLKTWQHFEAKCWLDKLTKVQLYERYNEVCHELGHWADVAKRSPEMRSRCRERMLPLAYEALAIFRVL